MHQVAWRLGLHIRNIDLEPRAPAVVFHVRTIEEARHAPPLQERRPNELVRGERWIVTADCPGSGR